MNKNSVFSFYSRMIALPIVQWNAIGISILATVLCGLGWVLNLKASFTMAWHIFSDSPNLEKAPKGFLEEIITVDLSTVTTLLLTVTIFFLAYGFLDFYLRFQRPAGTLSQGEKRKRSARYLDDPMRPTPFIRGYKAYYTELGLLGTLFAFIIAFKQASSIGVAPEEAVADTLSSTSSDILLMALGTALYSSFSAVFLAIIVCPAISYLFRRAWINPLTAGFRDHDPKEDDLSETARAVEMLTNRTKEAALALEDLAKSSGNQAIRNALTQLGHMSDEVTDLKKRIFEKHNTLEKTVTERSILAAKQIGENQRDIAHLQQRIESFDESDKRFRAMKLELQKVNQQFQRLMKFVKG